MIKLRNLEKYYESGAGRTYVLRQINVEVGEGEFITIMGPSGAGKTTLLSILGMLDGAWNGEYWLYDNPVHELKTKHRNELHKRYIGFVFQQYHLLDNLTVYENLDIPLSYRNVKRAERAAIVADSLDRFHIVGKKDLYPSQLSGGQQQLVAVGIGDGALVVGGAVVETDRQHGVAVAHFENRHRAHRVEPGHGGLAHAPGTVVDRRSQGLHVRIGEVFLLREDVESP